MSNINLIKKDNKVVVSSREIAENFEKEHSKVLRTIRNLECSKEFNEANFGLVEYEDKKGNALKNEYAQEMNKKQLIKLKKLLVIYMTNTYLHMMLSMY